MGDQVQVERFYLGCLAHASYAIVSGGEAAIIDPQRDVDLYLEAAERGGYEVRHVIETHLHADFVSGHRELAERTGAKIYLGRGCGVEFGHVEVGDGDAIEFGQCRLEFLTTPGHTLESICIVMTDLEQPEGPQAVFTGDTLFVGDVGRPDLSPTHSPQELAALLYASLNEKLMPLPDETLVYPSHGAGSLCGRALGSEGWSTIGKQKATNYALQARDVEEFVHLLTDSLPARPEYFARDAELNRRGAAPLSELPQMEALSAAKVAEMQREGVVLVDTRPVMQFAVGYVPGSVHIALTGQYASWAGRILGLDTRLIIVGEDEEHVRESQIRLARVGIEKVTGYLEDGVAGWTRGGFALDYIPQITAQELTELREKEPVRVLDVREPGEVEQGAIAGSMRIPLGELSARAGEIGRDGLVVVHCKGGYRSSVATSLLRRAGIEDLANLVGGYDAWVRAETGAAGTAGGCEGTGARG